MKKYTYFKFECNGITYYKVNMQDLQEWYYYNKNKWVSGEGVWNDECTDLCNQLTEREIFIEFI